MTDSAGPFNRPTGVTVADSGEIYVADGYGNARIHRFGPEGDLRQSWVEPGADPGEFRVPHGITLDDDGRVWIADRENSRIQIFEPDGEFVAEWNDLIRPTDLAVDGETVYVSELCKRVSVFTVDGTPLARWGNDRRPPDDPLFVAPHAIAVDSNGDPSTSGRRRSRTRASTAGRGRYRSSNGSTSRERAAPRTGTRPATVDPGERYTVGGFGPTGVLDAGRGKRSVDDAYC